MNELTIRFIIFTSGYIIGCIITLWIFSDSLKEVLTPKQRGMK